ncbi:uncharacterized protein LOC131629639 [Vicia villosa]|uniref:uncharacterized protein LOC131629639 n=1 Tax=Vicia villosa TaxID=3911 RepID=UPI00273B1091|nr:uncharacterized protein LOC131629639 [Vicia villosa]
MIISWNTRGLNKKGKLREISSRLLELKPTIAILLETRVKESNANRIRAELHLPNNYLDNYMYHFNGRVWIEWDHTKVNIRHISSTSQFIHVGVFDINGSFKYWLTAVYAHNQLSKRRELWKDIEKIHNSQSGPWCVLGDFNNVAKAQDRIGGRMVTESEYIDMTNMMDNTSLFEMESLGDYFTWANKHVVDPIYSRIDRVLGNPDWFQMHLEFILMILPPSVSDHNLLCITSSAQPVKPKGHFKFNNCLVELTDYDEVVRSSWNKPCRGKPMKVLWTKLTRLQSHLRRLGKPFAGIKQDILKARNELQLAQTELIADRMNVHIIEKVKLLTEEVINLNETEEKVIMQRAKIDWLRSGDGNNVYLYATLKSKTALEA